jgi:hypothetical protein
LAKKTIIGLGLSGDTQAVCVLKFTKTHLASKDKSTAGDEFDECDLPKKSTESRHWGAEHLSSLHRQQLQAITENALATGIEVKRDPDGLAGYYAKASAPRK